MDRFHAELHRQTVEFFFADQAFQGGPVPFGSGFVARCFFGDIQKALLGEVADEPGVGAVIKHCRCGSFGPVGRHFADLHLLEIKRFFKRRFFIDIGVGVPFLDRGIHIEDFVLMAPRKHVDRINVPGKIDDHAAGGDILGKSFGDVDGVDPLLGIADALFDPRGELLAFIGKVEDRDVLVGNADMLKENRQRAFANRAKTDAKDLLFEIYHDQGLPGKNLFF